MFVFKIVIIIFCFQKKKIFLRKYKSDEKTFFKRVKDSAAPRRSVYNMIGIKFPSRQSRMPMPLACLFKATCLPACWHQFVKKCFSGFLWRGVYHGAVRCHNVTKSCRRQSWRVGAARLDLIWSHFS